MSDTKLRGSIWKFGDNVSGDDGIIEFSIIREGFGKAFDEDALRAMCFRRLRPEFPAEVRPGDLVVGGSNFGHHNHVEVSVAIKASGIGAVVVESCESGIIRRALNVGLPIMICPGIAAAVEDGEMLEADPATGLVTAASGRVLHARPFSARMVQVWRAGGAIPLLQQEFAARRAAAPVG
ncbi:3-isopropylmalate/(R)-2-methylmalate dehydratase small subunit [Humitalea rosea]|uniref:3-isopropylmalate/(R)-2-methylmalate dehydratase small subunit n=1 Tax=Humitalea rosea TaxID=990373 RepID=A0A2W7K2P0_9PROT|nr:3-isopropylmalate dehydratase [Humitalea rosea]PZW41870.1 3-isopropylmalate/(R)-2-methylmalate dehydratase small subunit [Humitalea rosea]